MRTSAFRNALRVETSRCICSGVFFLQTGLFLLWLYLNSFDYIAFDRYFKELSWPHILNRAATSSLNFSYLIMILGAVGYAWSYLSDRETGFALQAISRVGAGRWAAAKYLAVVLGAFAAAALAVCLFGAMLSVIGTPRLEQEFDFGPEEPYMSYFIEGSGLRYVLIRALVTGLSSAFAGALAIVCSAFLKNRYVTMITPLLLYLSVNTLAELLNTDTSLSWYALLFTETRPTPAASLTHACLSLLALTAICGGVFVWKVRKEARP